MRYLLSCSLGAAVAINAVAAASEGANPIRRVVTILQDMQKELEEEGRKEAELYKNFQCYCKKNQENLSSEGEAAAAKIDELRGKLDSEKAEKSQLDQELVAHKADREAAKADLDTATAIREKERLAYEAETTEYRSNVDALNQAIAALSAGMGKAFLQGGTEKAAHNLDSLRAIAAKQFDSLDNIEKRRLDSFLQNPYGAYQTSGGEIVGILKQMDEEMRKDLGGVVEREEQQVASFEQLKEAKNREIEANTQAIESKSVRSGQLAVDIVNTQNELDDTVEAMGDNQRFLLELKGSCGNKDGEFSEREKARNEEIVAVSEAIKVLNDDDALGIFQNTLNKKQGALLLQRSAASNFAARAKAFVTKAIVNDASSTHQTTLALLSTLLSGKAPESVDFTKVVAMIEDMVNVLKQEQVDDDKHRDWCRHELGSNEQNDKDTQRKLDGLSALIADAEETLSRLHDENKQASDEIAALDQAVAQATDLRKKEHEEFVASQTELNSAVQLIEKAINRLNRVYNPAAYKEPASTLTEEERIAKNLGATGIEEKHETIAGTSQTVYAQIHAHDARAAAPPPPPETWGAYQNKGQKTNGVITLMNKLLEELRSGLQAGEHEEKEAQKDYEAIMEQSRVSRDALVKGVNDRNIAISETDVKVQEAKANHKTTEQTLLDLRKYNSELHSSCDFLNQNFDIRKEARTSEIDSLTNAKAVLAGANYGGTQF